ncbi:LINE-1 retrotransposable element ORF2 protein, partial [Zancudomyces culisetae]
MNKINGKLLTVIKELYANAKIKVRVGNTLSEAMDFERGVRQGCPASPMLFDIFINDIFEGMEGIEVPGIQKKIPGLLFADDTVLLSDTPEQMQEALN